MDFFQIPRRCLALLGHNIRNSAKDWSPICHWGMLLLTASLNPFLLQFIANNLQQNLQLAIASLSICLTNSLTCGKAALFLYKKKFFISKIEQLEKLVRMSEGNKRVKNANDRTIRFSRRYCLLCMMTGVYFMLIPFVKMAWQKYNGADIVAELPFPAEFNFNYQTIPTYSIISLYNTNSTWFVVFYIATIDCLFYSFSIILSTQFQVLQDQIKTNDFDGSEDELKQQFHDYIKYQNLLLSLCEQMRILFKPVLILQFLLTSLQVCLIVFQLVTYTEDLSVLIPNITFLVVILLQPFIYCYGGEIIMHESLELNWTLQTSKWYKLSPKMRRTLCFMIQRSQRPIIIQAGFYRATLEMFMTIVQSAASYITLMRSFA